MSDTIQGCHFTWKNLEFNILGKKNLEKPEIQETLKKTWNLKKFLHVKQ